MRSVALVTGSSRGIGREVARQLAQRGFDVIVTARKQKDAERAAAEIGARYSHPLEAGDAESIDALAAFVRERVRRLDVLVNNAAILIAEGEGITEVSADPLEQSFRTNVVGPILITQRLAPLLRASGHGRVVNVSSGAGQLSRMTSYAPAYSISKAALNASTILFAHALKRDGVLVNCADPGWVRTDMGGRGAPRSVAEGADTIVWLATLPDGGPTGLFFHDRKPVAW